MVEAYCVKCKKKGVKMSNPTIEMTPKGAYMAKGKCPKCNTTMCALMSKDKADKALKEGAKKNF